MRAARYVALFRSVGGEVRGQCSRCGTSAWSHCPPLGQGPWFLQKNSEILLCSTTVISFLAWLLFLSLHPLTSLISTCLHLFFGTQGRPQRLKSFSTNKKREQRGFCTQEGPHGSCLLSKLVFFLPKYQWNLLQWRFKNFMYNKLLILLISLFYCGFFFSFFKLFILYRV